MKFLLDTDAVIAILKGRPVILARIRQHRPDDFAVSAIVAHELYFGAFKGNRRDETWPGSKIHSSPYWISTGRMRAMPANCAPGSRPMARRSARARRLTLISRNRREFLRVADVHVEDWET